MKKFMKYGVLPAVIFLFLLFSTVMVLPLAIGIHQFHPEIEKQLSEVTGRPVTLESNVGLSFFPWLSISFTNFKIANPDGFLSDYFMKIDNFEARIKLLPLLKKKVEFNRFIVGGLKVNLEKRPDGKENWHFPNKKSSDKAIAADSPLKGWTVPKGITVDLFAVTNGKIFWNDQSRHSQHTFSDLMFLLHNVNLNDPIGAELKVSVDGNPLTAEGKIGPLAQNFKQGALPVDLAVGFLENLTGQVKGKFVNLHQNPGYNLEIHLPPFSIKDFLASLNLNLPVPAKDAANFGSAALDINVTGDGKKLSTDKGKLKINDTPADISLAVQDFDHPELGFVLDIDHLNLDRYLSTLKESSTKPDISPAGNQDGGDYSGWRKLRTTGTIRLKELEVAGGVLKDVNLDFRGVDGAFDIDSSSMLYQGHAQATMNIDLQQNPPQNRIDFKAQGVEIKNFLHDFWKKDFLSGTADTDFHLVFSGDSTATIQAGLFANGTFFLKDGELDGIDLINPTGNSKNEPSASDPMLTTIHTAFSELKGTFVLKKALLDGQGLSLRSPSGDIAMSGQADLAGKQWKMMVEPTNSAGRQKGVGPLTVSGTFAESKINIVTHAQPPKGVNQQATSDIENYFTKNFPSADDQGQMKRQQKSGSGKIIIRPLMEKDARF